MENKTILMVLKRSKAGGCPSRLQKRAPASLDIDKVLSERPSNPFGEASKAIPLLSPLIMSPQPLYAEVKVQAPILENHCSVIKDRSSFSSPSSGGWQHPALASFPEPSALCSIFQKQCVFVNHAQ